MRWLAKVLSQLRCCFLTMRGRHNCSNDLVPALWLVVEILNYIVNLAIPLSTLLI